MCKGFARIEGHSMYRYLLAPMAMLLSLPALPADDKSGKENPITVAGEYKTLMGEYQKTLQESDKRFENATTDEQRQKIRAEFQKFRSKFLSRVLAFAETHSRDKEALLALFFVLHLDTEAERKDLDWAVQIALKDHVKSNSLTEPPILQFLVFQDFPGSEKLLRGVLEKNPHPAMQAQACLSLAQLLKTRAGTSPRQAAIKLNEEAEELFDRVVKKYGEVKDVAELARIELFEIRHLALGKAIPDIKGTDSEGKDFKLLDYRGKVVVLSFWAQWCAPCMAMVPQERALVKRLEDKPFALVGVNRNASRESLKKCETQHEMTWRSFFDGLEGPISKGHNIKTMPTIFVLDAKGIIRYKDVRGEALDKAVDQLLAELEKETKAGNK